MSNQEEEILARKIVDLLILWATRIQLGVKDAPKYEVTELNRCRANWENFVAKGAYPSAATWNWWIEKLEQEAQKTSSEAQNS